MVFEQEVEPIFAIQMQINLLMDEVSEYGDEEIKFFDDWVEIQTVSLTLRSLNKKSALDKAIALGKSVLKVTKTKVIS